MRIATMMSIAVLGLSGAAIAQVTTDQETPPAMQNDTANNMAVPDATMGNDVMANDAANAIDDMGDKMDSTIAPTIPDAVPPTAVPDSTDSTMPPLPDGTATTPDDTGDTI